MNAVARAIEPKRVHPIAFKGGLNTTEDVLMAQVAENIRRGLPQVQAYQPNSQTAIIVAGGPSLKTTEKDLVEAVWRGGKVVAVNGTYQWCIDRNIKPSAFVMLDAREFNARFLETPVEECHYLLASQCHPKAFELCRDRQVTMWHALSAGDKEEAMLDEFYFAHPDKDKGPRNYHPVTLGTTVALRAISLMRMLGFTRMEIFGLDSCWIGDEHHAYRQDENNNENPIPVWIRPKDRDEKAQRFICSPWQAKQADDFLQLVRERGDLFELNVHGPGLIATILRTGADIQMENVP